MASLQAFFSFLPRAPKFPLPLLTPHTQAKFPSIMEVIFDKLRIG